MYSKWPHISYKLNPKEKNWKKCKGAEKLSKNCQNFTFWQFWGILEVFSLISWPPIIFLQFFSFLLSLYGLCGHFEYNKPKFEDLLIIFSRNFLKCIPIENIYLLQIYLYLLVLTLKLFCQYFYNLKDFYLNKSFNI